MPRRILGVALAAALGACAPPPPAAPAPPPPPPVPEAAAFGPGDHCTDTYVIVSDSPRTNFSLGSEYVRNGDDCAAYPYLRWMLDNEPLFTGTDPDDRNYLRMARIYEAFATHADSAEARAYLDSALTTRRAGTEALRAASIEYDPVPRDLAEAQFAFRHRDRLGAEADVLEFDATLRAFEAQPDSLDDWYLGRLVALSATPFPEATERAAFIGRVAPFIDDADARAYAEAIRDNLLFDPEAGVSDAAVDRLLAAFADGTLAGDDVLVLFALAARDPDRVRAGGGDPEAIRDRLVTRPEVTENVTDPDVLYALAMRAYAAGDAPRGDDLFDRALDRADSNGRRADYHYGRAREGYRDRDADVDAALRRSPAHGPSLFLRASDIATEVGQPASVRDRVAYWCLADRFRAAAATGDVRIADAARQTAGQFERAAPSLEEVFLEMDARPGDTVTASLGRYGRCTTRVR
ncbi:MAG: hypothetical protein AAF845_04940 [Bacteroidota bacterium]